MRNFVPNFIFEKDIQVTNVPGIFKVVVSIATTLSTRKAFEAKPNKIQFLTEGGSLVAEVESMVSYKCEDALGKGIECTGSVVTSTGDTIARFKTSHLGIGSPLGSADVNPRQR